MAINFPSGPIVGQLYSFANVVWEWSGEYWGLFTGQTGNGSGGSGGSGLFVPLSGGIMSGSLYTPSLISPIISGGTLYGDGSNLTNLPIPFDKFVTGFTFNQANYDLTIKRNGGLPDLTQSLSILATDMTITGGTYNSDTGTATFTNNSGGTFTVTGFIKGYTDVYTTGTTFNNQTKIATFTTNSGSTYTLDLSTLTTSDIYTTGATYDDQTKIATFRTNSGSTYSLNLSGFTTPQIYITEYSYDKNSNTFTIKDSSGSTFTAAFAEVTGLTVNGILNILSSSNQGINLGSTNTTPDQPIDIKLGNTNTKGIRIYASDDQFDLSKGGDIEIYSNQSANYPGQVIIKTGADDNSALIFQTAKSLQPLVEEARFSSSGNLLLGTSTDSNFKLDVNGTSRFSDVVQLDLVNQTIDDIKILTLSSGNTIQYRDLNDFIFSTNYLSISGGTVTGDVIFQSGITATTIYATTYENLPVSFDTYVTGFTYDNSNTFTISDNSGNTLNATINQVTGLTVNGVLTMAPTTGPTYGVINFSGDTFIHTYGVGNTYMGKSAGSFIGTGSDNVGLGVFVLDALDNGDDNTGLGSLTLTDLTGGTYNTAIGAGSFQNLISGDNNTGIGVGSNGQLQLGSDNTSIGFQTLFNNLNGSGNVAIGNKAGFNETGSNKLYIANNDSTTLIYGEFDNQKVGINTTSPTNTFHVSGSTDPVRFEGLQLSGDTRILTSDNNGVIRYRNFSDFTGSTVTINGGTNIQITGSYPNFGVNYTGQTEFPYLPLSGGTVTGNVIFQSGITATTIYATTYQNLPIKYYAEPSTPPTTSPLVLGTNSFAIGNGAEARSDNMISFGSNAGQSTTGTSSSFFLGFNAGIGASNSQNVVYIGNGAGQSNSNSNDSVNIGAGAGNVALRTGKSVFIGGDAGKNANDASNSVFVGWRAGRDASGSAYSNFIGPQAGYALEVGLTTKFSNLFGYKAGSSFTDTGDNIIGDNNIIVGTNISLPNGVSNSINIGGVLFGINTYSTSGGTPSVIPTTQGKIGIGIVTPLNRLHVEDSSNPVRFVGLQSNSTDNRILSSDSNGVIRYRNFSDFTGSTVTITGGTNIQITGSYPNFGVNYTGQTEFPYLPLSGGTVTGDVSINANLNISNSLHTTAVITANTGTNVVYSLPMGTYTGAFFDYVISNSGNLRAGNIMSVWDGVTSKYTEVSTTDFGDTSPLTFSMGVSGSNAVLSASATTNNWVVKVIIRSI